MSPSMLALPGETVNLRLTENHFDMYLRVWNGESMSVRVTSFVSLRANVALDSLLARSGLR